MSTIIVIDDERTFSFPAEYARDSESGLALLQDCFDKNIRVVELWLDHDLGGDDTIMPVVRWLEEMAYFKTPLIVNRIYVHTANPSAAPAMMAALDKWYWVKRIDVLGP